MRIAYLNTDEVNQAVAAMMASTYGDVVHGLRPKDAPPDGRYDAVLYNLDEVPWHRRRESLADILYGPSTCPKAVHGFDLSEEEAEMLRLHGVAVAQRLQPELFQVLHRTVLRNLLRVPPDDALLEETWINVAD